MYTDDRCLMQDCVHRCKFFWSASGKPQLRREGFAEAHLRFQNAADFFSVQPMICDIEHAIIGADSAVL